jgi:hypothetical protein
MGVFFDHIPKTAGTSITLALSIALDETVEQRNEAHHVAIKNSQGRKVMAGHFWFAPGEFLAPSWYYATILRDPIDRFVSQYYFHRISSEEQPWIANMDKAVGAASRLSIEEYLQLDDPTIKESYSNYQARHFASRKCLDVTELSDDDLFDAAIASLEEYDLIGIFDDLPGFLDVLCTDNAIPPPKLGVHNKTDKRAQNHELPPGVIAKLHAHNQVDLRLVAWAKEHFSIRRHDFEKDKKPAATSRTLTSIRRAPSESINFGNHKVRILSVQCRTENGDPMHMHAGQRVDIVIEGLSHINESQLTTGIAICRDGESVLYGINTAMTNQQLAVSTGERFTICFSISADLAPGTYHVTAAFHQGASHERINYEWRDKAATFQIVGFGQQTFVGRFDLRARITGSTN